MRFRHGPAVEVWRGVEDRHGDRTDTLALVVEHVGVQWKTSQDVGERGGRPVTTATLIFDHTPDIRPRDVIVIRGIPGRWHTEGRVRPVESPLTGWAPGALLDVMEVD